MNERIKELAEQTGYIWRTSGEPQIYEFTPEKLEKFAELIVRECITTMTNLESDIKQKFPWKKEEVVSTSGHIQKLKEHFGVK
jgi:adenosyl cobinamide kinase/adenosyl cobinamide phosphate guanylyltransferase